LFPECAAHPSSKNLITKHAKTRYFRVFFYIQALKIRILKSLEINALFVDKVSIS